MWPRGRGVARTACLPNPDGRDEIRKRELGIGPEGCNAERHRRRPEVDEVGRPQRQGGVEQRNGRSHAKVYARPSKPRNKMLKGPCSGERDQWQCNERHRTSSCSG